MSTTDDAALQALHARLAAAADAEGILDVVYRTIDSPVGALLLAATEEGLVRVAYANEDHDAVLGALADRISPRILEVPARLDVVARELEEYFAGRRRAFDVSIDWRLTAASAPSCCITCPTSPTGTPRATPRWPGSPATRRQCGRSAPRVRRTRCRSCVPCHRVVRSDGTMGGYLGGIEAKRTLLSLEAAA